MKITLKEFKELIKNILKEEDLYGYTDPTEKNPIHPKYGREVMKDKTGRYSFDKYNLANKGKKGIYNLRNVAMQFVNSIDRLSIDKKLKRVLAPVDSKMKGRYINDVLEILLEITDRMGHKQANMFFDALNEKFGNKATLLLAEIIVHLYLTGSTESDTVIKDPSIEINGEFQFLNHTHLDTFMSIPSSDYFLAAYSKYGVAMPNMYKRKNYDIMNEMSGNFSFDEDIKTELEKLLRNTIWGKVEKTEERASQLMDVQKKFIDNARNKESAYDIAYRLYKYELDNLKR